jgi:hypothetical protein
MSILDSLKGSVGTNLLIGVGVAILMPVILPVVTGLLKTTTKAVVKTGTTLFEKGTETVGEVGKIVGDYVSETMDELVGKQETATAASAVKTEDAESV